MKTYRSLKTVEAVQVTMDNRNEVAAWCGQEASAGLAMAGYVVDGTEEQIAVVWFKQFPPGVVVVGQDETLCATQGMWVVRTRAGRLAAWTDENFRANWEEHA